MTSLSEVYDGEVGTETGLRRLYLGVGLFLLGAVLAVAGILAATMSPPFAHVFANLADARHNGGVLVGVGVPVAFLGLSSILPAGRKTRIAAIVGACVAFLGVALFYHAYPCQWSGSTCHNGRMDLTLPTAFVYFAGMATTFWCFFVGAANFKTRNDPGGTVRMEVTREGETQIIEVERSAVSGLGGVGLLGATPDGDVETQTAAGQAGVDQTVSDGGAPETDISSPMDRPSTSEQTTSDAEIMTDDEAPPRPKGDTYCGNCAHFRYVRTENGMQPYCGLHDEAMDSMDACDQWTPRGPSTR